FRITHGYNLVMLNHAWSWNNFILRAGGGAVVAHHETIVRGLAEPEGYHFTGPVFQVAGEERIFFGRFFVSVEGKLTAARAHVPVALGEASAPNVALHGIFGGGFRF